MFYVNKLQWEAEMEEARRYYYGVTPAPQETDDEGFTGKCPTCGQEYHPNQEN